MVWHFLTGDLHGFFASPWAEIILALTSVICGAIVGAERERHEKPAGLRTIMLVCLGSTTFTMASYAFTSNTGDSGRVAAQIVTGVGFLGAGAILHGAGMIRGMTTAATVWAIAATGMVVGIGYAGAGLALSLLVRLVLTVAFVVENRALGEVQESQIELAYEDNGGKTRVQIEKAMEDFSVNFPLNISKSGADGLMRATLRCRLLQRHRREFLYEIAQLPEVKEINETR